MTEIKFLFPFWWQDHVYDDFDEWRDTWTSGIEHYKFLWELNDAVPMDGVLFSRNDIEKKTKRKNEVIEAGGIKNFLRLPDDLVLFGDCGAFGYSDQDEPPYEPVETLEFYEQMQYDQACTVDHVITSAEMEDKEKRWDITLSNAEKMLEAYKERDYSFDLFGVAQGWDPESYYRATKELLDLGFQNIAIGGLVRAPTKEIIRILQRCYPLWMDKEINVHLFGVARWQLFPFMQRYGVNSLDNTYHKKAFRDKKYNYIFSPEELYTAVRIPISDQWADYEELLPEEKAAFEKVKAYSNGDAEPEDVVNAVEEWEHIYADLKGKESRLELFDELRDEYLRTLRERPWEKCDCHICEEYGVHVAIFRRNERNMRRGFHNLYRFYHYFNGYLEGDIEPPEKTYDYSKPRKIEELDVTDYGEDSVLVLTSCSKSKKTDDPNAELPAEELYQGRLVQNTRNLCKSTNWDHRIISAKYGLVEPGETISPYERTLNSMEDAEELKSEVIPELAEILGDFDHILVIAGKHYREVIEPLYDNRFEILNSAGYPVLCKKIKDATPARKSELQEF